MPSIKPYFDIHPTIGYTFTPDGSSVTVVTDIINRRAAFRKIVMDYSVAFYDVTITEAESTPEILSSKLYGSPQYHYILLLANNIQNVYTEWPLPSATFFRYLQKKYGTDLSIIQKIDWTMDELSEIPCPVHSFYTYNGRQIDFSTYEDQFTNNPTDTKPTYTTFYEYENTTNDAKRKIVVPRPVYISRIHNELYNLMATNSF